MESIAETRKLMADMLRKDLEEIRAEGARLGLLKGPTPHPVPKERISSEEAGKKQLTDFMGLVEVPVEHIVNVASDTNAMLEALSEYGYRMMIEEGPDWDGILTRLLANAKERVIVKIVDELKQKQGYRPPE